MTWYKVKVPADAYLPSSLRMMKFFGEQYIKHRMPKNAALLISDTPNRIDPFIGQNWFYFTPEAAAICKQMLVIEGAIPCDEPTFDEASWIAGDESYLDDQRRQRLPGTSTDTG